MARGWDSDTLAGSKRVDVLVHVRRLGFHRRLSPLAAAAEQTRAAAATSSTAIPEKSIAVLPFENLSANQDNAFFTDGVQNARPAFVLHHAL